MTSRADSLVYAKRLADRGHLALAVAMVSPSRAASATLSPPASVGQGGGVRVVLPYPPSVNLMYRAVNGRAKLSAVGRAYKARVESLRLGKTPLAGDVAVSLWFYRPRKAGDLDNSLKATLDALKGVAFEDDAQVQQIHACRYEDKANPRVEVVVSPVAPVLRAADAGKGEGA